MAKDRDLKRAAGLIRLASHPIRVVVLLALRDADEGIEALQPHFPGIGPAAVIHHLRMLHVGSAIEARREGLRVVYSLTSKGRLLLKAIDAIG